MQENNNNFVAINDFISVNKLQVNSLCIKEHKCELLVQLNVAFQNLRAFLTKTLKSFNLISFNLTDIVLIYV